ncbi:MAG: endonuclease/exonuclease/phosphatase family protein [Bacteroidales bacterium]|nr:endonuclease/exonuclease/phosphatase family protein [Bacteroidales bacterium]
MPLLALFVVCGAFLSNSPLFASHRHDTVRVVFYNAENLFDIVDDPFTSDDEFTEEGLRHWNNYRLYRKLNNLAKTLLAAGGWTPPGLIGLCETENRLVLEKLIHHTALGNIDYRIIHHEGPDPRGIDVALLYRESMFVPDTVIPLEQKFPGDELKKTREILYVKGVLCSTDTVHVFVNHWPSKYGGVAQTQPLRNWVANTLRRLADSVLKAVPSAHIVIMGDLNDNPSSESVAGYLKAREDSADCQTPGLRNLMYPYRNEFNRGTHKFHEHWEIIDHIIVSPGLICPNSSIRVAGRRAYIFEAPFLLIKDEKFLGHKPNRTFSGPKYLGGYSDHLPVYIDLIINSEE